MPRSCRFCGATHRKITSEHVWPRWLADFVPPITGNVLAERWSSRSGSQEWQAGILEATVNTFCETCNSGWMADIEGTARPILGPMVQGNRMTLDANAQRAVAHWAVLKGLVAAQVSKDEKQFIPDWHYERVRAAQGAPTNTVLVWIAQREDLVHPDRPGRVRLFDSHVMPLARSEGMDTNPVFADYIAAGRLLTGTIFQARQLLLAESRRRWHSV